MTVAFAAPRGGNRLATLLGVAALLVVGSGGTAAYLAWEARSASASEAVPVDALYGIAIDAEAAVAGDEAALGDLQRQLKLLKDAAVLDPTAPFATDPHFTRLVNNAAAVIQARSALADAGRAARETRDLVPRLLAEIGTLASALPGASLETARRTLERFELRAQKLQLDVTALAAGAANPNQAAQRLAESTDYLGQVIQALQGANTGLGLPRVTAPEAAKHLQALDSLYTDLNSAVRRAVAAAPALPTAQSAARAITADARALGAAAAATGEGASRTAGKLLAWTPLALAVGALVMLASARRGRRATQGERPQPAGDSASAR